MFPVEGTRILSHLQRCNFLLIQVHIYKDSSATFLVMGSEVGGNLGSC